MKVAPLCIFARRCHIGMEIEVLISCQRNLSKPLVSVQISVPEPDEAGDERDNKEEKERGKVELESEGVVKHSVDERRHGDGRKADQGSNEVQGCDDDLTKAIEKASQRIPRHPSAGPLPLQQRRRGSSSCCIEARSRSRGWRPVHRWLLETPVRFRRQRCARAFFSRSLSAEQKTKNWLKFGCDLIATTDVRPHAPRVD